VAGVVLSLAQGRPIRDAVLFGRAAGAAAVITPGSELCRRDDVERLRRCILSGASKDDGDFIPGAGAGV